MDYLFTVECYGKFPVVYYFLSGVLCIVVYIMVTLNIFSNKGIDFLTDC